MHFVKEKPPDAIGTHCTIHRQTLMVKTMPDKLKSVLNDMIKAVNLIKASALNSRLFADLCKEIDEFKRKVLNRVFVLRKKIHEFLYEATAKQIMYEKFSDDRFLIYMLVLVDIFESVKSINLALQGREFTVLHCHEILTARKIKSSL